MSFQQVRATFKKILKLPIWPKDEHVQKNEQNHDSGGDFHEILSFILKALKDSIIVCELVSRIYLDGITSKMGCAGFTWRKKLFPGHSWKGQVQAEKNV